MPSLVARILDAVPLILAEWRDRMTRHPDGSSLPGEGRNHQVERLLRRLLEAAVAGAPSMSAIRACLEEAAEYASRCRRAGREWHEMLTDFDALRRATWTQMERLARDSAEATRAILRVDMLIGDAVRASALGYYRESVTARVSWRLDEAIEEIARDSLLLAERWPPARASAPDPAG